MKRVERTAQNPLLRITAFYLLAQAFFYGASWIVFWVRPRLFAPGVSRFILIELLPALTSLCALLVMAHFIERRTLASYGFARQGVLKETLLGFLIGCAMQAVYMVIAVLAGWYKITGVYSPIFLPYSLFFFLLLGINEETLFRGYIFQTLESRWGSTIAFVVTCVLFGLAHVRFWSLGGYSLNGLVQTLVDGCTGGILYISAFLLRRRMWLPIGLHWGWDFSVSLFYGYNNVGLVSLFIHQQKIYGPHALPVAYWLLEALVLFFALSLLRIATRKDHSQNSKRLSDGGGATGV